MYILMNVEKSYNYVHAQYVLLIFTAICSCTLTGIPVSHQHLIYGTTELMDDLCLEEYQ